MDVRDHRRRRERERERQYLYVGRNLQGQRHRAVFLPHLAFQHLPFAPNVDDYDALFPLEDACRSSLTPLLHQITLSPCARERRC